MRHLNFFSVVLLGFAAVALIATAAYPERETWVAVAVFAGAAVLVEVILEAIDRHNRQP